MENPSSVFQLLSSFFQSPELSPIDIEPLARLLGLPMPLHGRAMTANKRPMGKNKKRPSFPCFSGAFPLISHQPIIVTTCPLPPTATTYYWPSSIDHHHNHQATIQFPIFPYFSEKGGERKKKKGREERKKRCLSPICSLYCLSFSL